MLTFLKSEIIISFGISLVFHGLLFYSFNTATYQLGQLQTNLKTIKVHLAGSDRQQRINQKEQKDSQQPSVSKISHKKIFNKIILSDNVLNNRIDTRQTNNNNGDKISKKEITTEKIIQQSRSIPSVEIKAIKNSIKNENIEITTEINTDNSSKNYLANLRSAINKNQYYPSRARQMKIQGNLWIEFLIYRDGRIEQISIRKSSGKSVLDRAARKSLQKLGHYQPFPKDINAAFLSVVLPMRYVLD